MISALEREEGEERTPASPRRSCPGVRAGLEATPDAFEAVSSRETVTLRDGTEVTIRPIRPDDAARLQALFARLSPQSIYFRFFGLRAELPRLKAENLARVDYKANMALVAGLEEGGEEIIIGVSRYAGIPGGEPGLAEAAIVVEDRFQRRGLGTLLLERLANYARKQGIRAFLAEVMFENTGMMQFIRRSGLRTEMMLESGIWEIRVWLEDEPAKQGAGENRASGTRLPGPPSKF